MLENNSQDNADGNGVTLRALDNPSDSGGSIFAVRSSAQAARLWVGQSLTSFGDNDVYCCYTSTPGDEGTSSNYKHSLTDTLVTFGTPVVCQFDLQCVDLTVSTIYGGAVAQITNQINAALPNAFYCAGLVSSTGVNLSSTGREGFTVSKASTGVYNITFSTTTPRASADYPILLTARDQSNTSNNTVDDVNARYRDRTTTGFQVRTRRDDNGTTSGTAFDCEFSFMVL